jgi:GNAT superfamily N-acetyltransferase
MWVEIFQDNIERQQEFGINTQTFYLYPMNVVIRKAVKDDCAEMMGLIRELADYEKASEEVTVDFDHFVESGFGKDAVWWALVAEVDGKVEGMALYYIRYSTWKGQTLYLEDLVVNPVFRGKGIGAMMMDALISVAKERKCNRINWQVLDWNQPAIHFYEKYNVYKDEGWINFHLEIV